MSNKGPVIRKVIFGKQRSTSYLGGRYNTRFSRWGEVKTEIEDASRAQSSALPLPVLRQALRCGTAIQILVASAIVAVVDGFASLPSIRLGSHDGAATWRRQRRRRGRQR